jgi:hypothetical protein
VNPRALQSIHLLGERINSCMPLFWCFLYYSVLDSLQLERISEKGGNVTSRDFSDSRKPIADSQDLPELKAYNLHLIASLVAALPRTVFGGHSIVFSRLSPLPCYRL